MPRAVNAERQRIFKVKTIGLTSYQQMDLVSWLKFHQFLFFQHETLFYTAPKVKIEPYHAVPT